MATEQIKFQDGASYERFMGVWSAIAGDMFLDWIRPAAGLRWADIGCGNGAFTERIVERCKPDAVEGLDPSQEQLAFARSRPAAKIATFTQGDAQALPLADQSVDVAIMALVIFFVPDPAKGVAEMARITKPGGLVAAYAWDMLGGGFPIYPLHEEMRAFGHPPMFPPRPEAAQAGNLRSMWMEAGLEAVETCVISPRRTFANFDEYWSIGMLSGGTGPVIAKMSDAETAALKERVRARLDADSAGRITWTARANAVKGIKPR